MGKDTLSNLLLLFAGMNAVAGGAVAKLDLTYLVAGLGTGALLYYCWRVLNSEKDSLLKRILTKAAER
jgi:hypothetical protein